MSLLPYPQGLWIHRTMNSREAYTTLAPCKPYKRLLLCTWKDSANKLLKEKKLFGGAV